MTSVPRPRLGSPSSKVKPALESAGRLPLCAHKRAMAHKGNNGADEARARNHA